MRDNQTFFTDNEFAEMTGIDIQTLVATRLEDMADQVNILYSQGDIEEAELLRAEGLELAQACDEGYIFLFVNDLSEYN